MTNTTNNNPGIDFDAIAAMLCGEPLTQEQQQSVSRFNSEYDRELEKRETASLLGADRSTMPDIPAVNEKKGKSGKKAEVINLAAWKRGRQGK